MVLRNEAERMLREWVGAFVCPIHKGTKQECAERLCAEARYFLRLADEAAAKEKG